MAKDLKEQIEIMTHYLNGGEIEVKGKKEEDTEWGLCDYPIWDWVAFEYRIKEKKQKVTIEKWLIKDVNNGEYFIMESSEIETYYKHYKQIKLIESYEVEL